MKSNKQNGDVYSSAICYLTANFVYAYCVCVSYNLHFVIFWNCVIFLKYLKESSLTDYQFEIPSSSLCFFCSDLSLLDIS